LITFAERPGLDKVREKSGLRNFIEKGNVFGRVTVLSEFFEIEEITRVEKYVSSGIGRVLNKFEF